MRARSTFRWIAVSALIGFLGVGWTARASNSPNLDAAINYLKAAKTAEGGAAGDPADTSGLSGPASSPGASINSVTANLNLALKFLNRATNNKGGKRGEVIDLVKQARGLITSGNQDGANEKIDHAIAELYAAANHRGGW